jgi:hypothetical protein
VSSTTEGQGDLLLAFTYDLTGVRIPLDRLLAFDAEELDGLADILHHSSAAGNKKQMEQTFFMFFSNNQLLHPKTN